MNMLVTATKRLRILLVMMSISMAVFACGGGDDDGGQSSQNDDGQWGSMVWDEGQWG